MAGRRGCPDPRRPADGRGLGQRPGQANPPKCWLPPSGCVSRSINAARSGGYGATLTGGYGATLTGGDGATLTGGDGATLTGGDRATLTGGDYAELRIRYLDAKCDRWRTAIAYVGENGIKAGVAYRLNGNHEFVEADQ